MTRETLTADVDSIIAVSSDPETAHISEDELYRRLIGEFCPDWVVVEINRLLGAEFPRWCA